MAWANFLCSEKQGNFNDLSSVGTNYTHLYDNLTDAQADFNSKVSGGTPIVKNETLVGDNTTGVITDSNPYLIVRLNGNYVTEATGGRAPSGNTQSIFIAVIDEENQYGNIGWVTLWNPDSSRFYVNVNWATNPTTTKKQQMYTVITSNPIITYTWTSVPAISGKNGILSLPTLIDTDGEPISGQSASVFSSLPEGSNVRALINGAL